MSTRGAARRQAIVDTARNRFTTLGYDGTTIGDLATELDISKAAVAYYFPTKDTFLDEFVTPFVEVDEAAEHGVRVLGRCPAHLVAAQVSNVHAAILAGEGCVRSSRCSPR